jgi:hypothetical protein
VPRRPLPSLDGDLLLSFPALSALRNVRAIVRELRSIHQARQMPEAIVVGPELYKQMQDQVFSYLWSTPARDTLFGLPLEISSSADGWTIRVR